jgi:hypothetical protein
VLLTKTEAVGRLVFWLAYPCAAAGQYLLLRTVGLSRTIALVGVLILISTPLVASSAIGLKPELWSVVTLLGVAYWVVSICLSQEGLTKKCFFLGVFTVLSINVRAFPFAILPSVVLIAWWAGRSLSPVARLKPLAAGLACAGIMSSLLVTLTFNTVTYHHPLGPPKIRQVVEADITPKVIYTHAVRFAFLLLELPDVPASAETRARFSDLANQFIAAVGAGAPLSLENDGTWPGRFLYSLPERSTRFSLWGLLWIPTLLMAVVLLVRNVVVTWPHVRLAAVPALSLMAIPLLAAVLFGTRWMAQSEVPARYLIGPYALMLPIGIAVFGQYISGRKLAASLVVILVSWSLYQPIRILAYNAMQSIAAPISEQTVNQPFEEAMDLIPAGSRILLVGNQDALDYPLFSPGTHYSNAVIPWGKAPFDPARMHRLINSEKVTHVLIQDDKKVTFYWAPALETEEMVHWLAQEPGLKAIELSTPHMRLFETGKSTGMNEAAFHTLEAPSSAPLIAIGASLKDQVGIDPTFLRTPWPVEHSAGTKGGFLWIGQGRAEGVEFGLWSRQDRDVDVRFDAFPGPSVTTPDRTVMLLLDELPADSGRTFNSDPPITFRIRLHVGRNVLTFFALNAATLASMPNGDTRHLVVGIKNVRVEAPPATTGDEAQKRLPEARGLGAGDTWSGDLARSAQVAAGLISSRQQSDGYWLTSYTSEERFERTTLEMNTFLTSMMIDVLSSWAAPPAPIALGASLERARMFLRSQIEAGGLVRYHGRSDTPAFGTFGRCAITPDTDDTALVWRIAPGAPALLPAAIATLVRYRTAEGLYQTWLGHPKEYQCIDPGKDPNPTDAGIQMHVFMLLAQIDPPAAQALCNALRHTIAEDRLWVYYSHAPLVPILRQTDLEKAGCELKVPLLRLRTTVAGQSVWLTTVQLLRRLDGRDGPVPTSTEILDLLRELAKDNFSVLRQAPPLVYHNDLTASVRRFYWSEDLGYALWLRLYSESGRHGFLPRIRPDDAPAAGSAR